MGPAAERYAEGRRRSGSPGAVPLLLARWPAAPESLRAAWREDFDRNWSLLSEAVDTTRQHFLVCGTDLAETVYHSTCGGHTASATEVWGQAVPYLSGVPCEYCEGAPRYRETKRLALADAASRVGADFLTVAKTTPSGRAEQVTAAGRAMTGDEARAKLGLSSTLIEAVSGDITVTTRGYGHGVGLCQWGADGQARLGRNFREILFYYYPGTTLAGAVFGGGGPPEPPPPPAPGARPVVVIDPGHGGVDPGATGPGGLEEKTLNLAIALAMAEFLAGHADVAFTRQDDSTVALKARTDLSKARKATVFLSLHSNAATSPAANGTETFHFPGSRLGTALAGFVQRRLVAALRRRGRGVKEADFYVLRHTDCPAALAEVLFLTNPQEAILLASRDFQRRAAEALVAGILDYLAQVR